jgi:hypothetical protein
VVTPEEIAGEIYNEAPVAHPSVMFRRDPIRAAGGYRDGEFPEDYELWLRLHERGLAIGKCPEVLLYWRERPDRTSRTDLRYERTAFDRLRARYLARDPRVVAGDRPVVIWGAGRRTRQRARHLIEHGIGVRAWIDIDPRKIGREAGGLPVHEPGWLDSATPRPFVLVYVRNYGAPELIAARLLSMSYEPRRDWLPVG